VKTPTRRTLSLRELALHARHRAKLLATLALLLVLGYPSSTPAQDDTADLFDPSISACSSAPDAAWYYQVNAGSDERCQISDIRSPLVDAVWSCTSGDCSTLTAAAGDSIDASGADSTVPWEVDTTAAPTNEGRAIWDSDDDVLAVGDGSGTKIFYPGEHAPYGQYDPLNPPTSCAACDEFTADTEALSWSWGNQDAATATVDLDSLKIAGDGTDELHVRGTASPSAGNTDFSVTVLITTSITAGATDGCALGVVSAGSIASPTKLHWVYLTNEATDGLRFWTADSYAFASAVQHGSTVAIDQAFPSTIGFYLQLRYDNATATLSAYHSWQGYDFSIVGSSTTLAADPHSIFVGARDAGVCRFQFVRARTDADRHLAGE